MIQANFLKYAFAQDGNKTPIDVERNLQGLVSARDGYTPPYSNDPQAGGEFITREVFNGILYYFTKEIQTLQINGLNELDQAILTTKGYPKGARCVVWLNIQNCKLDINGATNPLCVSVPIVSMKDQNQTNPYNIQNALFGDWWLDDGCQIGEIRTFQVSLPAPPDGYLDLAPNEANPSYTKESYPRIKAILGDSASSKWGFFQSTSETNFTIINPRGRFPRVWSNGSSIDNGRLFDTLQGDAIRNITGRYLSNGSTAYSSDRGGRWAAYDLNPWRARGAITDRNGNSVGDDTNSFASSGSVAFNLDVSKVVPTTDTNQGENRPYNFNQKMYIKV